MRKTYLLLVTLLLSGSAVAAPIQWKAANGGNGHYYEFVPVNLSWADAKTAAEALSFQGMQGHLITITSQAESDFFGANFGQGTGQTLFGWLGGFQDTKAPDYAEPAGGWRWVTGETWSFTNWWTEKGFPDNFNGPQDFVRSQPVNSVIYWDDIQGGREYRGRLLRGIRGA